MHIIQFYRILWAKRLLIIATTISCLIGGFILTRSCLPGTSPMLGSCWGC